MNQMLIEVSLIEKLKLSELSLMNKREDEKLHNGGGISFKGREGEHLKLTFYHDNICGQTPAGG